MKEEKASKAVSEETGTIEEILPGGSFRVKMEDGRLVTGILSGKMRMYRIKIVPGDKVTMEFSPYDQNRGRISRRL
ncbi:MAG: translation initiation factor IF-1 [Candidatus Harrisonbacteria bacterium]|nr:translation initiation factor IF-1 [Candidatus Harrisonbacteria bacterium]